MLKIPPDAIVIPLSGFCHQLEQMNVRPLAPQATFVLNDLPPAGEVPELTHEDNITLEFLQREVCHQCRAV